MKLVVTTWIFSVNLLSFSYFFNYIFLYFFIYALYFYIFFIFIYIFIYISICVCVFVLWITYENASICKEVFLKKTIAETSNKMVLFFLIDLWNDTMGLKFYYVICDYLIYVYIYIYAIMKTMCPPSYNHSGFVPTHALGDMKYMSTLCIVDHLWPLI